MSKLKPARIYYKSWISYAFWQVLGTIGILLWEPVIQWRLWRARR